MEPLIDALVIQFNKAAKSMGRLYPAMGVPMPDEYKQMIDLRDILQNTLDRLHDERGGERE